MFPTTIFSSIGSRHPLLLRFHPSLHLHEKRENTILPLKLNPKWPRTRKMMSFTSPAVPSRQNINCQEPETPANAPTSLHCCFLVRGESRCPFPGVPTPFRCHDFDQPFFNANATFEEDIKQPRVKQTNTISLQVLHFRLEEGCQSIILGFLRCSSANLEYWSSTACCQHLPSIRETKENDN